MMIMLDILKNIMPRSEILVNEKMAKHITFNVGGEAKFFVYPYDEEELCDIVRFFEYSGQKYHILGNGSNTLFMDEGYDGVVLCTKKMTNINVVGDEIECGAGVMLGKLASIAKNNSLAGAEFLACIPATCGGAVRMNAGCYNHEICEVLKRVRFIRNGNIVEKAIKEGDFSYRECRFLTANDIVVSQTFKLKHSDKNDIAATMELQRHKRALSQPLEFPSAGSVFKRPKDAYAAKLIDECGLKGHICGGAMVSTKHAGFIINFNHANCLDVLNIIDYIIKEVYNRFRVVLQLEVVVVK